LQTSLNLLKCLIEIESDKPAKLEAKDWLLSEYRKKIKPQNFYSPNFRTDDDGNSAVPYDRS
jgi:hypothetical protein